ncbi:hypothetical protein [Nocardia altamirensis]|uniref:hypothetical protein n=1 Tax=Nocardia altamirensis TaxID=472158 RepID=UPI00084070F6|nr:hypothetical protein [Nocardia altamirensis]
MILTSVRLRWTRLPDGEWDFATPLARQLAGRFIAWMNATRWRRWIGWPLVLTQMLLVTLTIVAPDAAAATTMSATSWTGVTDSYGVPASEYLFSTDHGSAWHPLNIGSSNLLQMEFGLFLAITITAIWLLSWTLSFRWLDLLHSVTVQINTSMDRTILVPGLFLLCASIGALVIGFAFTRGQISKGTIHIVSVLVLAILGITIFAHPVEQMLSQNGPLIAGRDIGLSIAAGLTGNGNTDAQTTVTQLQGNLVDHEIRHPLQLWNFGQIIDYESPMCSDDWSAAVRSGDEDRIKNAMRDCGSPTSREMKMRADRPNGPQIGTGFVLLVFSTLLLAFGVVFSLRILWYGCKAVGMAVLALPAYAASQIPGAPQVFYLRCLADAVMSAVSMAGYIILLGVYSLALKSAFEAAKTNGIAVIFLGAVIMVLGLVAVRRLGRSLDNGSKQLTRGLAKSTGNTASGPVEGAGPGHRRHHMGPLSSAALWYVSPQGRLAMAALRGAKHTMPNGAPGTGSTRPAQRQGATSGWPGMSEAAAKRFRGATVHHRTLGQRVVEIPADHPHHPDHPHHQPRPSTRAGGAKPTRTQSGDAATGSDPVSTTAATATRSRRRTSTSKTSTTEPSQLSVDSPSTAGPTRREIEPTPLPMHDPPLERSERQADGGHVDAADPEPAADSPEAGDTDAAPETAAPDPTPFGPPRSAPPQGPAPEPPVELPPPGATPPANESQ